MTSPQNLFNQLEHLLQASDESSDSSGEMLTNFLNDNIEQLFAEKRDWVFESLKTDPSLASKICALPAHILADMFTRDHFSIITLISCIQHHAFVTCGVEARVYLNILMDFVSDRTLTPRILYNTIYFTLKSATNPSAQIPVNLNQDPQPLDCNDFAHQFEYFRYYLSKYFTINPSFGTANLYDVITTSFSLATNKQQTFQPSVKSTPQDVPAFSLESVFQHTFMNSYEEYQYYQQNSTSTTTSSPSPPPPHITFPDYSSISHPYFTILPNAMSDPDIVQTDDFIAYFVGTFILGCPLHTVISSGLAETSSVFDSSIAKTLESFIWRCAEPPFSSSLPLSYYAYLLNFRFHAIDSIATQAQHLNNSPDIQPLSPFAIFDNVRDPPMHANVRACALIDPLLYWTFIAPNTDQPCSQDVLDLFSMDISREAITLFLNYMSSSVALGQNKNNTLNKPPSQTSLSFHHNSDVAQTSTNNHNNTNDRSQDLHNDRDEHNSFISRLNEYNMFMNSTSTSTFNDFTTILSKFLGRVFRADSRTMWCTEHIQVNFPTLANCQTPFNQAYLRAFIQHSYHLFQRKSPTLHQILYSAICTSSTNPRTERSVDDDDENQPQTWATPQCLCFYSFLILAPLFAFRNGDQPAPGHTPINTAISTTTTTTTTTTTPTAIPPLTPQDLSSSPTSSQEYVQLVQMHITLLAHASFLNPCVSTSSYKSAYNQQIVDQSAVVKANFDRLLIPIRSSVYTWLMIHSGLSCVFPTPHNSSSQGNLFYHAMRTLSCPKSQTHDDETALLYLEVFNPSSPNNINGTVHIIPNPLNSEANANLIRNEVAKMVIDNQGDFIYIQLQPNQSILPANMIPNHQNHNDNEIIWDDGLTVIDFDSPFFHTPLSNFISKHQHPLDEFVEKGLPRFIFRHADFDTATLANLRSVPPHYFDFSQWRQSLKHNGGTLYYDDWSKCDMIGLVDELLTDDVLYDFFIVHCASDNAQVPRPFETRLMGRYVVKFKVEYDYSVPHQFTTAQIEAIGSFTNKCALASPQIASLQRQYKNYLKERLISESRLLSKIVKDVVLKAFNAGLLQTRSPDRNGLTNFSYPFHTIDFRATTEKTSQQDVPSFQQWCIEMLLVSALNIQPTWNDELFTTQTKSRPTTDHQQQHRDHVVDGETTMFQSLSSIITAHFLHPDRNWFTTRPYVEPRSEHVPLTSSQDLQNHGWDVEPLDDGELGRIDPDQVRVNPARNNIAGGFLNLDEVNEEIVEEFNGQNIYPGPYEWYMCDSLLQSITEVVLTSYSTLFSLCEDI